MDTSKTPPQWRRPEDVMKLHKLRLKKRCLDFRLTDQGKPPAETKENISKTSAKRNPFKRFETESDNAKKIKVNIDSVDDTTTDGTLFRLLNFSQSQKETPTDQTALSFCNALSSLNNSEIIKKDSECTEKKQENVLFVDWTLREKVRLLSKQSFPWNQKRKTCEEASGITGFVRCIDTDTDKRQMNLDTSPNARFHQCCLVWQHPSIPWLSLYPRIGKKSSTNPVVSLSSVKDCMYQQWLHSFHSLFQLVRAKQCPYFYVIANTFVCLFRAAGLNGFTEINASITPTTRGFRQLLKDEDIEFSMPLKIKETKKNVTNDTTDTGYESNDVNDEEWNEPDDNDEEEPDVWLQKMGMQEDAIKKFNSSQIDIIMGKEKQIDDSPESLVFVEGVEAQALFNFLVNCKSVISTTGYLAGVPPTLLSPVAFTGASLTSFKVRESQIRQNETCYHSMEITGPILPHTIHSLCDLMKNANLDKFSLTFANIKSTKAFTAASVRSNEKTVPSPVKTPRTPSIFDEQNLSDCGLKPKILARFCKNEMLSYDSIKFSDSHYTCS